jgi:hypothetical protein
MQTPPQTIPVMSGGMREILSDFTQKQKYQVDFFLAVLLILGIVFVHEIGLHIRNQLDTLLGRLFAFGLLILVTEQIGVLHGILLAIFLALVLSQSTNARTNSKPSLKQTEGFAPDFQLRLVPPKKHKWWIEEVMKENPIGIEDEKVNTSAIQDNQVSNRSSQQDTKSSTQ